MSPREKRELLVDLSVYREDVEDRSEAGRKALIAKIEAACREERKRGMALDWKYNLARHQSLLRHLERERRELALLQGETLA